MLHLPLHIRVHQWRYRKNVDVHTDVEVYCIYRVFGSIPSVTLRNGAPHIVQIHSGVGIIFSMYFMHRQQSGCEKNESKRTLRRAVEIPSHRKLPTPRQSASNIDRLCAIWRNIQGEEPDRKLS
jgi:hypothetical protein